MTDKTQNAVWANKSTAAVCRTDHEFGAITLVLG